MDLVIVHPMFSPDAGSASATLVVEYREPPSVRHRKAIFRNRKELVLYTLPLREGRMSRRYYKCLRFTKALLAFGIRDEIYATPPVLIGLLRYLKQLIISNYSPQSVQCGYRLLQILKKYLKLWRLKVHASIAKRPSTCLIVCSLLLSNGIISSYSKSKTFP